MEVGNITKAAASKSSPKLLKNTITFFVTVLSNTFMRQTLTDDWGLHKNMNNAFPLMKSCLASFLSLFIFMVDLW